MLAHKSEGLKKTVADTRIPAIDLAFRPISETESPHFLAGSSESARLTTVPAEKKETLTARTQAEVIDYLQSAPKYYSQIVSNNGRKLKVFSFPSTFSLGEVTCSLSHQSYTYQAQEKLGIPMNSNVALSSNAILQFNPELLSHFRSDDLHSLTLDGTAKFADRVLQYISRLTSLRVLVLRQVPLEPKNIKYLNCLTNLYSLKLTECNADPATLLMLTPLRSAERISLDGGANVSALLKVLSRNTHLAYLQLGEATLSKRDVASLASMRSLESLSIRSSSISNEDIEALTALTNLRYLILNNSKADEKCVKSLLKFRKLEYLVLSSVEMPLECKVRLQKALPKLRTMQFSATDNQMFDLPDDLAK
jgi:Leucine-rich repeat (LRR) protein